MKKFLLSFFLLVMVVCVSAQDSIINLIFTSDVHYGLLKEQFRGEQKVSSAKVNSAMVVSMNHLPEITLPTDNGVCAGRQIGSIEAVIITGDICNREENNVQSAAASWKQFQEGFINQLQLKNSSGQPADLLLTPGNHDISNAIGFHRPMIPLTDNTALVEMYNKMLQPAVIKTSKSFNYQTDKIYYSRTIGGIHFAFADAWPDSTARVWLTADLKTIPAGTPVLLLTHSIPDVEARFFTNPNGDHSINEKDKFENLVNETFKDGNSVDDKAILEQRALSGFIHLHPEIKAYFHGHNNYTEFYTWTGPDKDIQLPCFRADSPMKGRVSSKDETQLSFQLISIDRTHLTMTVRECLWNTNPLDAKSVIKWGQIKTISLQ